MADDLLIGVGADIAGFRRDRAIILSEAQGLQRDIARALANTEILPDLGAEARAAGVSVINGLRDAVQDGGSALRGDVAAALVPTSLGGQLASLRNQVTSGISDISRDFGAEGEDAGVALVQGLQGGLKGAVTVLGSFAGQATKALQGANGILGDLTPQAERAGRSLVTGLRTSIQRDSAALQADVGRALVPAGLNTAFTPVVSAARDAAREVTVALGAGGVSAGRALTSGLTTGLGNAEAVITQFANTASGTLERANLLAGLGPQGVIAGTALVSGVTKAITSGSGQIQRAITTSLVPTNLPADLTKVTDAVTTVTARLVPALAATGTSASRALITSLSTGLTQGTAAVVTGFARGASGALNATNLLGDVTPIGERAGAELSAGVAKAITREAVSLRATVGTALVPTNLSGELGRLEGSITSALARFPTLFRTAGAESGQALVTGITARLSSGTQILTTFAQETSKALTGALTIGDVSGSGETAGRALASAIATGITSEAPRVREAIAAALLPAGLTADVAKITASVESEVAQLAPALATEGANAGRALVQGISGEVTRGSQVLRQLTQGATIGVVVDTAPIRAAVEAEQQLTAAAQSAAGAVKEVAAATASFNTAPLTQAAEVAGALADAETKAATQAQDAAGAFIRAWKAQQDAGAQAAAATRAAAADAQRAAQAEIGAREQVRGAITQDIAGLREYATTVDATNAKAVEDWEQQATLIRENARELGIEGEALFKLDGFIRRTSDSFRLQAAEARNAARAISEQGAAPRRNLNSGIGADLSILTRQANSAKTAVSGVTIAGRSLQQITGRLGPALVGVGFGLESLARGGDAATTGLRTALRAVASFAVFFGPEGFIVAGVAAATAAIIDLFQTAADESKKATQKMTDDINQLLRSGDFVGIQRQLRDLEQGIITFDPTTGRAENRGGLKQMEEQAKAATAAIKLLAAENQKLATFDAKTGVQTRGPFDALIAQNQRILSDLQPQIETAKKAKKAITELLLNPPTLPREITGLKPVVVGSKDAEDAVKKLGEQVSIVSEAFKRVNGDADLQSRIIAKAIPLYDQIRSLAQQYGGQVSETTNDLAKWLKELIDIDAISIELTRRKLGGIVPDVAPVKVTAIIDRFTVPAATKIQIPVDFDPKVLNDSLREAVGQLDTAKNAKVFAEIFGSRQQVAAATKNVDVLTGNLTRTFRAAIAAELASADADVVKTQRIKAYAAAANELGLDLVKTADRALRLTTTLGNIGDAVGSIARVADEIGGIDRDVIRAVDSVGRLADALGQLTKLKFTGKDSIFSGFNKFLESLPVIGETVSAVVNAQRSIIGAISGKTTDDANKAIIKSNTEALQRLHQDLLGFGEDIRLLTESRALTSSTILQARAGTSGFQRGFKNVEDLDRELRDSGTSLAELKRRAEAFGITITDAKGRISALGLSDLNHAIKLAIFELTHFKDTLADQLFIADARRDIFDQTDINSVANDWLDQLHKFAPDLFTKLFRGADTATKQGREVFEQGIRDAFNAAIAGKIPDEVLLAFGGIRGFIDFLTSADHALDSLAESAKQAAGEMINVAQGFAVSNRVFKAITQGLNQRDFFQTPIPQPGPRPGGVGIGTASTSQAVNINVSVAGVTVSSPAKTKDQVYATLRQQALDKAAALGPTYVAAVEAAFPA